MYRLAFYQYPTWRESCPSYLSVQHGLVSLVFLAISNTVSSEANQAFFPAEVIWRCHLWLIMLDIPRRKGIDFASEFSYYGFWMKTCWLKGLGIYILVTGSNWGSSHILSSMHDIDENNLPAHFCDKVCRVQKERKQQTTRAFKTCPKTLFSASVTGPWGHPHLTTLSWPGSPACPTLSECALQLGCTGGAGLHYSTYLSPAHLSGPLLHVQIPHCPM